MEEGTELKQHTLEGAKEVAEKYKVNSVIMGVIDNSGLANWNEIERLPKEIVEKLEIKNRNAYEMLVLGNIFAKSLKFPLDKQPSLLDPDSSQPYSEEERQAMLRATILAFTYPKGIDPTNEVLTFQISQEDIQKLGDLLHQITDSNSLRNQLEELGFVPNPNLGNQAWYLKTGPAELKKKIESHLTFKTNSEQG